MGLATYLTRVIFLVGSKNLEIPKVIHRSLKYIPVSILATLIFPGIFMPNGKLGFAITNPYIGAAIVTIIVVLTSKNSIISIIMGIGSLLLFRFFIG
jgi:branched-subunit amino acid transport protein